MPPASGSRWRVLCGPAELSVLRRLEPDWFAVRGAVCRGGERDATVETAAVRRLIELLGEPINPTARDS